MIFIFALLLILLPPSTAAAPGPSRIRWGPCPTSKPYKDNTSAIECGSLPVPLDYTAVESGAVYNISLVRAPAPKQPAKGAIQFNFGGPGQFGISSLVTKAAIFQRLSGEEYDLVAFDPRGVSAELKFICSTKERFAERFRLSVYDSSNSEHDARRAWALAQQDIGLCQNLGSANETAEYIGTSFVARDIERVAQEVDKDALIRFWGFSYGTTLGVTIASMFPDRIGGMVLDGIQNAKQYYFGLTDSELWTLTDQAVEYFFYSCAEAGPNLCPLATANRSGSEMTKDFYNFLEVITHDPIGIPEAGNIFDGSSLKAMVFQMSYAVDDWAENSTTLLSLLYGTPEERHSALRHYFTGGIPLKDLPRAEQDIADSNLGIHCGDRVSRIERYEDIVLELQDQYVTSYVVGGSNAIIQMICAQWPWKAKEIYKGNFEARTRAPILFMSNSLDGQTPIKSARNMSAGFEGAIILENDGVGHTAYSYPSTCQANHVIAYWNQGELPENGTICRGEFGPFKKRTWLETLEALEDGQDLTRNVTISARNWLQNYYNEVASRVKGRRRSSNCM